MITIEQVPMWGIDRGIGHIVLRSDTRWTSTACGVHGTGYSLTKRQPKKICSKCRAALNQLKAP
jgi:hypothetical protein